MHEQEQNQEQSQDWDFGTVKLKPNSQQFVSLFDIPPPPQVPKQFTPLKIINRSPNASMDSKIQIQIKDEIQTQNVKEQGTIRIKTLSNSTLVKTLSNIVVSDSNSTNSNSNSNTSVNTNTSVREFDLEKITESLYPFKSSIPFSKRQALIDAFKAIHQHDKTLIPLVIQELYKNVSKNL